MTLIKKHKNTYQNSKTMTSDKGAISQFMETYYLHFNAASVVDASKGYEAHLQKNGKMLIALILSTVWNLIPSIKRKKKEFMK